MPPPTSFAALRSLSRLTSRTSLAIPRLLVAPQCPSRQALPKNFYRSFSSSYPYRSAGRPLYESADPANQPPKEPRAEQPSYQITVTCEPCGTRSSHKVSKQGYHHGSTLITCPQCKNRHVISDHLKVFGDAATTVEDLMRARGQTIKKGSLSEDGELEFWEDGTVTRSGGSTQTSSDVDSKSLPELDNPK